MKKVLLVSYYFPPYSHPGVQRVLKFARYLKEYGYEPVVLTCGNMKWDHMDSDLFEREVNGRIEVIKADAPRYGSIGSRLTSKNFVDKTVLKAESIFWEDRMDWAIGVREQAFQIVRERGIDIVLTSGPPQSVHFVGSYLKRRALIPWIIDFRDPMYRYAFEFNRNLVRKMADFLKRNTVVKHFEKEWVAQADGVVSVTDLISRDFRSDHPDHARKVHTVSNGFDEEDFRGLVPGERKDGGRVRISYTGRFWGLQSPTFFLDALRRAVALDSSLPERLVVEFTGDYSDEDRRLLTDGVLEKFVVISPPVDHKEALQKQINSDVNLLIITPDESEGGDRIFTGKFFEYLRAGRPIFAMVPNGPVRSIIIENRLGVSVGCHDASEAAGKLLQMVEQLEEMKAPCEAPGKELLSRYERKELTGQLAAIFDSCLEQVEEQNRVPKDDELPSVSVVIITKGRHEMAAETVGQLLKSDYPAGKLQVVVLEETNDKTPIEGEGVVYRAIPEEGHGFGYARNEAVKLAGNDLIVFVDDDCVVKADWLKLLVTPLVYDSDAVAVGGAVRVPACGAVGQCESILGFPGGGVKYLNIARGRVIEFPTFSTCSCAVRKSAFDKSAGFEERLRMGGEDETLAADLRGMGKILYHPGAEVVHAPRDNIGKVFNWFVRRGHAAAQQTRIASDKVMRVFRMIKNSVILRTCTVVVLALLLQLPMLPVLCAAYAVYYAAVLWKFRWSREFYPAGKTYLLLPVVKSVMDFGMDIGLIREMASLFRGKGSS